MKDKAILVAEIGSTTTIVSAFDGFSTNNPILIGQGQATTTVEQNDVTIGLNNAINDLIIKNDLKDFEYKKMFATSSAAGGLKMTVHGLVYDMTVKASKEAALGAGANIHFITSGKIRRTDANKILDIMPNIILIAGGVDYGERDTALYNAEVIASLDIKVPVIYAGNIENCQEIELIFSEKGKSDLLYITENVYPSIDTLNVEPTRRIIQSVFEEHITKAPGMEKIKELVNGRIIPTPGAVMASTILLEKHIGDLLVFDVGGATTDVHSVVSDFEEKNIQIMLPEPKAKRTVEGDLGMYVNFLNVLNYFEKNELINSLGISEKEFNDMISEYKSIPKTDLEKNLVTILCEKAVSIAINRHMGHFKEVYSSKGKVSVAYGKDLRNTRWIVGTGGALTKLPKGKEILENLKKHYNSNSLCPSDTVQVLIDNQYIMSTIGVICEDYPDQCISLLKNSFSIKE